MKQLLRPDKHKLAVLASVVIVVALTALGVYNQRAAENAGQKVGSIQRTVEVQHTEVVQALCNQPFTSSCLTRALNILRTCRVDRACAHLLGAVPIPPRTKAENRVENGKRHNPETSNSSQGIREPGGRSGGSGPKAPGPPPPTTPPHGKHQHPPPPSAPPAETSPQSAPEPAPAPGRSGEAPGREPEAAPGAKGVVPQAVEGVVECVPKLEIGCATQGILGAN